MVDECVVIDVLLLVGYHTTEHPCLGILAAECEVRTVARQSIVERQAVDGGCAAALLINVGIGKTVALDMRFLQFVEFEVGILTDIDLTNLCGEELVVVDGVVAEENLCFGSLLHDNEHTAVDHQVHVGTQNVDYLQRALYDGILGHMYEESILTEHGVQGIQSVLAASCQPTVILFDELGHFLRCTCQRHDLHTLGEAGLWQCLVIEAVVDHKVERGAEVGHIAAEHIVGIDGDVDMAQVKSVVWRERLGHIGIFVSLQLLRRQTQPTKVLVCLLATRIQHGSGVPTNKRAALLIQFCILKTHPQPLLVREGGGNC